MTTKINNRMIDGATVNVLDFGAVGDGITDDAAAIQTAIDSLPKGGKVIIPRGRYRISTRIFLRPYINLIGEGWSVTDATVGTILIADAGQSAVMLEGQASVLQDMTILSGDNSTGSSATGVAIRHLHCTLRNINVGLFGGKGITVDSRTAGNNCNEFRIDNCRSYSNGSDGLFIDGVNSNAGLVTLLDTTGCAGTGIWCKGSRNTFQQCHVDMAGIGGRACYDDAISNIWNVYVESAAGGGSNFEIGSASSHGVLEALFYAKPDIIGDSVAKLSWRIYDKDGYNIFALNDTNGTVGGSRWQLDNGISSAGTLRLRNTVDNVDVLKVTRDGSRFIFSGHIEPSSNGTRDIGTVTNNYRSGYFVNAPTVTCDKNLKTEEQEIPTYLLTAALEIKGKVSIWKWLDRVNSISEGEGANARYHIGPYAQEIIDIFEKHMPEGDSVWNYGFVLKGEDGKLMIRPTELMWLIIAAL